MKSRHDPKDHPYKLYADGGVIGKNPSPYGGTWACVLTYNGTKMWEMSGVLLVSTRYFPAGKVTNNQSELFAILKGMAVLPATITLEVCSDSNVSLGRVFSDFSMNNIPSWMCVMKDSQIRKFKHWDDFSFTLLDGHPTRAQLDAGKGKRGHPVSEWNVLCDKLCHQEAEKYMKEREQEPE
jgi:ribonuclease HI